VFRIPGIKENFTDFYWIFFHFHGKFHNLCYISLFIKKVPVMWVLQSSTWNKSFVSLRNFNHLWEGSSIIILYIGLIFQL
jgi:hypothetical protein